MAPTTGDWLEYKNLIIDSMRNLQTDVKEIRKSVNDLNTQLVALKTEMKHSAKVWGLLAGAVPGLLVLLIWRIIESM